MMTDSELLHYARQILLSDVDVDGQKRLKQSHVVDFRTGWSWQSVALYLGAAGVGRLTLVDGDTVDETNLHRQVIHSQNSLNQLKVESARGRILGINPWIEIDVIGAHADDQNVDQAISDAQCIADCTDRFATRFLANHLALKHRIPTVSAAALGVEGQLTTIDPRDAEPMLCLSDTGCSRGGTDVRRNRSPWTGGGDLRYPAGSRGIGGFTGLV